MKVQLKFICNKEIITGEFNPAMTVLDFLRNLKELKGTKEGCREGDCGACTVLVGELAGNFVIYKSINSCLLPIGDIDGKHLVSIEGINIEGTNMFQQFLVDNGGTQCGFCTPGFVISFASYLLTSNTFEIEAAKEYLTGNLCRCTGHKGIIRAVEEVVNILNRKEINTNRISFLVENKLIPEYFNIVASKLKQIQKNKLVHSYDYTKQLVAGGTDIYVQKGEVIASAEISLASEIISDEKIKVVDDLCVITSTATVEDMETSTIINNIFPDFKKIAEQFGSKQIRNKATIGGNINNASPIGDMTIFFLALNAKVHLLGKGVTREVFLKEYFKEYKVLNKNTDELMTKVTFKIPNNKYKFSYEKVCRRHFLDIASVNTSIYSEVKDGMFKELHISAGGVAPIPLYLAKTVEYLNGKEVSLENIQNAVVISLEEISPITDSRGSVEYKKLLLRNLLYAHFIKLFPEIVKAEVLL